MLHGSTARTATIYKIEYFIDYLLVFLISSEYIAFGYALDYLYIDTVTESRNDRYAHKSLCFHLFRFRGKFPYIRLVTIILYGSLFYRSDSCTVIRNNTGIGTVTRFGHIRCVKAIHGSLNLAHHRTVLLITHGTYLTYHTRQFLLLHGTYCNSHRHARVQSLHFSLIYLTRELQAVHICNGCYRSTLCIWVSTDYRGTHLQRQTDNCAAHRGCHHGRIDATRTAAATFQNYFQQRFGFSKRFSCQTEFVGSLLIFLFRNYTFLKERNHTVGLLTRFIQLELCGLR